jgi:Glu-tRNA(Gln) amidotransferase subunit E-like FAD-binding protein
MPGRAAFYPDAEIPLKNIFELVLSDSNAQEYQSITSGESVKYSVKGVITAETAWSLVEKEFQSSMQ